MDKIPRLWDISLNSASTVHPGPPWPSFFPSLSRELMLASEGNPDSYAIGKKEELERQAEAAHN